MLFNSLEFIGFFVIVVVAYYAMAARFRWVLLLGASCYFYMAFVPIYLLILAATILVDYVAGIAIEQAKPQHKKQYLIASLVANIGVLAMFKYYPFLTSNLTLLLAQLGIKAQFYQLTMLLPIGLSFHTFQAMSYTIEVYRGRQAAERHLGIYALYVLFFPQLVAGPIERPQNVLYQFYETHRFNYQHITNGLKLMAWGFFKKIVIADRLAPIVNAVYNEPQIHEGWPLIIATIFFAFQIYCDFSGYSDIALGSAEVLGFRLMKNFNRPYWSSSVSEFWQRWHISLSTWFRDYLYIPLGGNRLGRWLTMRNLFCTFLVSGLWHGANWTYVMWGALNGGLLIAEQLLQSFSSLQSLQTRIPIIIKRLLVFSLICLTWVFFRANSLSDAYYIITHLWTNQYVSLSEILSIKLNMSRYEVCITSLVLGVLIMVEWGQQYFSWRTLIAQQAYFWRYCVYVAVICAIILLGVYQQQQQFIYFQF